VFSHKNLPDLASFAVFDFRLWRHIVSAELAQSSFFMASLPNYLRTHRKRLALSQEEVAFLLGGNGPDKGVKVCRDEASARKPSLQEALAYGVIYGQPVRELFAGLYEQAEQQVAERCKLLGYRITGKAKVKEAIADLISKLTA
jgi:hypothetical protein